MSDRRSATLGTEKAELDSDLEAKTRRRPGTLA